MRNQIDILTTFGRRTRECRLELKLTQQQLADLSGLNRSYIGKVEFSKRNITLRNAQKNGGALEYPSLNYSQMSAEKDD